MNSHKYLLRKITAFIISIALIFSLTSCKTKFVFREGNDLNLDGYELVFYDEFDGDSLDTSIWRYRKIGPVKYHGDTLNEVKTKKLLQPPRAGVR